MTILSQLASLFVYALAVGGAVNLVKNGKIVRAYIEPLTINHALLAYFINCAFCQTYQAAIWFTVLFYIPAQLLPVNIATLWQAPITALAIARLSWLVNAMAPKEVRYEIDETNNI